MWTPKKVFFKKINFWPHKTIKYTKKSGIYALILHNYPILVRSTGIEDIRRYEKALVSKAFLLLNANTDAKIFWGRYDIAGLI